MPKAVLIAEHATCFFHGDNQAEALCEECGRFLCSVCSINFGGRLLCSRCVGNSRKSDVRHVESRTLYDRIALALSILVPFSLISGPVALGFVVAGFRKPGSLVSPGRVRLVFAGVLAVLEILGWSIFFLYLWLKR